MLRRCNTRWASGKYTFISGFIDGGETITHAAVREAQEECKIEIDEQDLKVVHINHRKSDDATEFLDVYFTARKWKGEVANGEPNKCDDVQWFSISKPPINIVPHLQNIIQYWKKKSNSLSSDSMSTFYSKNNIHSMNTETIILFVYKKAKRLMEDSPFYHDFAHA